MRGIVRFLFQGFFQRVLMTKYRVAYSFIVRHLAKISLSSFMSTEDDDITTARQLFRTLTPFLLEKNSKTLLTSMDDVSTGFWSKLVETGKATRESFPLLLRDAAFLLAPKRVVELSEPEAQVIVPTSRYTDLSTHPHVVALRAFSDIYRFYQFIHAARHPINNVPGTASKATETPTTHKLRFYAAYIALLPSPILASFASEVASRAASIEKEIQDSRIDANRHATEPKDVEKIEKLDDLQTRRPVIEEI